MDYNNLGKNIKMARVEKDMTQEQLAKIIGCSTVFISEIEKAKKRPSLETLHKISIALGIGTDELFYGKTSPLESAQIQTINTLLANKTPKELSLARQMLETLFANLENEKLK
ncbi:MAG: helix-turn-helix domain-containing protein [Lachnospiraceae bacterium]